MTSWDARISASANETLSLPGLVMPALRSGLLNALSERTGPGEPFRAYSSGEVLERAQHIALGLRALGLVAGDRVGILSPNCVAWVIADLGIQLAGMVTVPMFATLAIDQATYILRQADIRVLFLHDPRQRDRLLAAGAPVPLTFFFEGPPDEGLARLEHVGEERTATNPDELAHLGSDIPGDALCTLIYTSGTTGDPKGVMLTHRNFTSNIVDVFETGMKGVLAGDPVLSVLPMAHIYERMITYGYLWWRCAITICHGANEVLGDLRAVRPAIMTGVPRLFEQMLATISGSARAKRGFGAWAVPWALAIGREYARARLIERHGPGNVLSLQYVLARALVLRKIRPLMGLDRLRFFVSGGAAMHVDTALTFAGFDVPILQGYGLTETSPVVTFNDADSNRLGSVGRVIPTFK